MCSDMFMSVKVTLLIFLSGDIDYSPSEISFVFSESSQNQTKCSHINIIKDGLDEKPENFSLLLYVDDSPCGQQKNFSILACRSGGKVKKTLVCT